MSLKTVKFEAFPASWRFTAEGITGDDIPRAIQTLWTHFDAFYPEASIEAGRPARKESPSV
jgi:hypothetical protein